ncbi:MAG: cation:proton antiporter [Spirochaetota bacterium]
MSLGTILGQSVILFGLLITGFGVYTVLRLDNFYARMVVTSKVEAMGFVTVVLGAMILSGLSAGTLKLLTILVFELLTVSVSAHAIARSAWVSGYRVRTVTTREKTDD